MISCHSCRKRPPSLWLAPSGTEKHYLSHMRGDEVQHIFFHINISALTSYFGKQHSELQQFLIFLQLAQAKTFPSINLSSAVEFIVWFSANYHHRLHSKSELTVVSKERTISLVIEKNPCLATEATDSLNRDLLINRVKQEFEQWKVLC